jgi:hypothetical protein
MQVNDALLKRLGIRSLWAISSGVEALPGAHLSSVARDLAALAGHVCHPIALEVNTLLMAAMPGETGDAVMARFTLERDRAEAKRAAERKAKAREEELAALKRRIAEIEAGE